VISSFVLDFFVTFGGVWGFFKMLIFGGFPSKRVFLSLYEVNSLKVLNKMFLKNLDIYFFTLNMIK